MTTFGLIPFDARPPLQLLLGLALMALPFALGIEPIGTAVAVVAGVAVVGVALSSVRGERGLPALPLSAVHGFDWTIALSLLGAALTLGVAGQRAAMVLLAAFGAAHLALTLTTRWTLRG